MNTQTTHSEKNDTGVSKKGFWAGLFARIDDAMKKAAEKKAKRSCCCSGDDNSSSGQGGKCC